MKGYKKETMVALTEQMSKKYHITKLEIVKETIYPHNTSIQVYDNRTRTYICGTDNFSMDDYNNDKKIAEWVDKTLQEYENEGALKYARK